MKLQVGVKILIQSATGQYLMLKRSEVFEGESVPHWDIPGGRIEPDEALFDALRREVSEETGLSLSKDIRLIGAQDIFVKSKELHVVRLTYTGTAEGEVVVSDEHDSYEWMDGTAINLAKNQLDPYLRELLGAL